VTQTKKRLSKGAVAGIVVGVLFAALIIITCCCFRRRTSDVQRQPLFFKRNISKPIPQRTADDEIIIGDRGEDPEKGTPVPPQPPQVQLNIETQNAPRKSWRLSGLGFASDRVSRKKSQISCKPSLSSLGSGSFLRHIPWAPGSLHAQRLQGAVSSSSAYPQNNQTQLQDMDYGQPITWASSLRASQVSNRHNGVFPPARPYSELPPGQGFANGERHGFHLPNHMRRPSWASNRVYADSESASQRPMPVWDRRRSQHQRVSLRPKVVTQLPLKPTVRESTVSSRSSGISRPVTRRGPCHTSFFASGPSHRRMSSAAGRRFGETGLGLSTIDGSPGLGAEDSDDDESPIDPELDLEDKRTLDELKNGLTQNSSKYWETTTTDGTSALSLPLGSAEPFRRESKKASGPFNDCTWNNQRNEGESSLYLSRGSSVYSRNYDGSSVYSSGHLRIQRSWSRSPTKSIGHRAPPTPIMQRTRAAYRLGGDRDRTPLRALGTNQRAGEKRKNRKGKGKEREVFKFVPTSKARKPISVDGGSGIGSLKAQTSEGNEAFI
jgi:hypothetical protein